MNCTCRFWIAHTKLSSSHTQKRFVDTYNECINAVVLRVQDRDRGHTRTGEEYFAIRRNTIGIRPTFALLEAYIDLPQEVIDHPIMAELRKCVTDILLLSNVRVIMLLITHSDTVHLRTYTRMTSNKLVETSTTISSPFS